MANCNLKQFSNLGISCDSRKKSYDNIFSYYTNNESLGIQLNHSVYNESLNIQ